MIHQLMRWFEQKLNPFPDSHFQLNSKNPYDFIRECLKDCWWVLVVFMLLTACAGAIDGILFQFIGSIVDWLGKETPAVFWDKHATNLIYMLITLVASVVITLVAYCLHFQTIQGAFPMRLRWLFHRKLLDQSMAFYQDEFSGRVSAKVMQTALAVRDVVMTFAELVVYITIYFISMALILAHFSLYLLLPFILWGLGFFAILYYYIPKTKKASQKRADARSMMTGRITDAYANITTIKLFSHSHRETQYAKEAMTRFLGAVNQQMRFVTKLEVLTHANCLLLIALTAALGIYLWSKELVSIGAIAAATAMTLRFNGLSSWMLQQTAYLFENLGVVLDGIDTLSLPQTIVDQPNAVDLKVEHGHILFQNVCFAYHQSKPIFQNLTFSIQPGERIGIVGRSGAGKSSIVNLLLRFYDVQGGEILIDQQNIAQVTQHSLRSSIGMVTQDTSLLHRTIRQNIAYGKEEATEQEIIAAAKKAQAHNFIMDLSDKYGHQGYDTLVGERGVKLSGGQRQRIAIARVILKNAPILLLDEATSALDSEVENAIQDSLDELMENKTVVAIAHRLSTIAAMDTLIVLDKGEIVEIGTHQHLLQQQGLYAKLWTHQSGGFLAETFND